MSAFGPEPSGVTDAGQELARDWGAMLGAAISDEPRPQVAPGSFQNETRDASHGPVGAAGASDSQAPSVHWCASTNGSLGPSRPPYTSEAPA